jgi:hypothetical protein
MNKHTTIKEFLEASLYDKYQRDAQPRVEAGSNTSTAVLRVVVGDEKETQCLEV